MITEQHQRLVVNLTNGTGSASVQGQVVAIGSADDTYVAATADTIHAFGIVLVAGIPNGGQVPICIFGRCQVLMEAGGAAGSSTLIGLSRTDAGKAEYGTGIDSTVVQGLGRQLRASAPDELVWIDFCPSKTEDVGVADPS